MAVTQIDPFSARSTFDTGSGTAALYRLRALDDAGVTNTSRLPYCLRTILEALLRTCDDYEVTEQDVRNLATWNAAKPAAVEVPFKPSDSLALVASLIKHTCSVGGGSYYI